MQQDQEILFEKILELALKDKLVLWAGAGLSREAGCPTGWELGEILWNRLSKDEQKFVPKDLWKVSDYFVNRGNNGRAELILILKEIFKIELQKSESHEIIKKLAFFKTIITTNYDELFEDYIPDIQVIKTAKDLSRSNTNSRKLIKIHGDLKSLKRLVLTQVDYAKLYERDFRDPFWNLIRAELTQKGVLFIGYGFNDANVQGLFDYLDRKLKKHKQPKFLVAPHLPKDQQLKLQSLGIHYFNKSGKDFLEELYQVVWKTKGHKYFGLPDVSADSLFHSLKAEGLPINVSPNAAGGRWIQYNPEPGKVWDLTFNTKDKEVKQRIFDWEKGFGSDDLLIPKDSIAEANLKIDDFVVGDKSTLPPLKFVRIGKVYEKVRVVFEKTEIELEQLQIRIFRYGDRGVRLIAKNQDGAFEIIIPQYGTKGFSYNGTFTPNEPCDSISGVLKWYEAIYAFANGEPYKIFSPDLPKGYRDANGGASKNLEAFHSNRLIFQVLRKIEEKFLIRFSGLKQEDIFNEKTTKQLQRFLDLFRTNRVHWDISKGFPVKKMTGKAEEDIIALLEGIKEDGYLIMEEDTSTINFLGQDVSLGRKQVFITNPYLEKSDFEPGIMLLKSRNVECFEFFEAFELPKLKDGVVPKSI